MLNKICFHKNGNVPQLSRPRQIPWAVKMTHSLNKLLGDTEREHQGDRLHGVGATQSGSPVTRGIKPNN
jgi:hypothetical protein